MGSHYCSKLEWAIVMMGGPKKTLVSVEKNIALIFTNAIRQRTTGVVLPEDIFSTSRAVSPFFPSVQAVKGSSRRACVFHRSLYDDGSVPVNSCSSGSAQVWTAGFTFLRCKIVRYDWDEIFVCLRSQCVTEVLSITKLAGHWRSCTGFEPSGKPNPSLHLYLIVVPATR